MSMAFDVEGYLAEGGSGVCVEVCTLLMGDSRGFLDGFYSTYLAVSSHDGDDDGLVGDEFLEFVEENDAVVVDGCLLVLPTASGEFLADVDGAYVLDGAGDDSVALVLVAVRSADDGEVRCLCGGGGEEYLGGLGVDERCDLLSCFVDRLKRLEALAVEAARVADVFREIG